MAQKKEPTGADQPLSKWAATLASMHDVLQSLFKRRGRSTEQANVDACEAVMELANYFGGRLFYLPRGDRLKTAIRDQQISRRMGKETAEALAEEFGVTASQIYRINRQQAAIARASRKAKEPA